MNNNNLNQNKSQDDVLHLGDSFAGAYLPEVSINAIESLIENDKFSTAMFEFNGISLVVTKSSTVSSINKDYLQQSKENYELYLNSDEGKKQTIEREKIQLEYQNKGKILLNSFDDSLTSEKSLIKWLGEFSLVTDTTTINYDLKDLAQKMKEHNFDYKI